MTEDTLDRRSADSIPEQVQWHEGMLLSPQHLQQENWRHEAVLNYVARSAFPHLWGVRRLVVDDSLLPSGIFRLVELEALLPDGLILAHPLGNADLVEINLNAMDIDLALDPVTVHLTVPRRTARSAAPGALRRFGSVNAPAVVDENTGDNEMFIPRLRPMIDLDVTRSPTVPPSSAFVSCPIARVGAVEGRIQLLDYAYPSLEVTRGSPLHDIADAVARDLRDRTVGVVERLRGGRRGDGVVAVELLASLRSMTALLPRLEAMLTDGLTSPYDLYITLCDVAGHVAPIDIELVPVQTPRYVHEDPLPAYRSIASVITRAVRQLQRPFREVAFKLDDDGVFSLDLREGRIGGMLIICLYASPGQPVEDMARWIEVASIATAGAMDDVRSRRVRGAARRIVEGVREFEMTTPRGGILVAVEVDRDVISPRDVLQIRHPDGGGHTGQPARVVLITGTEASGRSSDKAGTRQGGQSAPSAGASQGDATRADAARSQQPPPPPRPEMPPPGPPPRRPSGRRE